MKPAEQPRVKQRSKRLILERLTRLQSTNHACVWVKASREAMNKQQGEKNMSEKRFCTTCGKRRTDDEANNKTTLCTVCVIVTEIVEETYGWIDEVIIPALPDYRLMRLNLIIGRVYRKLSAASDLRSYLNATDLMHVVKHSLALLDRRTDREEKTR